MIVLGLMLVTLAGYFSRSRLARWLLWGAVLLAGFAFSSLAWTSDHFEAMGCGRNPLSGGMDCPTYSLLTRLAMFHSGFAFFFFVFGTVLSPVATIIALIAEIRVRRRR